MPWHAARSQTAHASEYSCDRVCDLHLILSAGHSWLDLAWLRQGSSCDNFSSQRCLWSAQSKAQCSSKAHPQGFVCLNDAFIHIEHIWSQFLGVFHPGTYASGDLPTPSSQGHFGSRSVRITFPALRLDFATATKPRP